jgi:hypothetical protein
MWVDEQIENQFAVLATEMMNDIHKVHARHILLSMEFSMWLVRNALLQKVDKFWLYGWIPTENRPFKPFTYVLLK